MEVAEADYSKHAISYVILGRFEVYAYFVSLKVRVPLIHSGTVGFPARLDRN